MILIDIKDLQTIAKDEENVEFTAHTLMRLKERKIKINEIYDGINNGEIIEQYPNDKYYPSCLILCFRVNDKPLHFVCSIGIITVYDPDFRTLGK